MYVGNLVALAAGAAAFSWKSIPPSANLTYHGCYDSFECARLSVPIDFLSPTSHDAHLALIKLPARGNASMFGGTLFVNPGGPGASGVSFLRNWGDYLRYLVDKPGVKNYELVSFDPRGVANSWPRADCFDNDMTEREAVAREIRGVRSMSLNRKTTGYQSLAYQSLGHFMSLQRGVFKRCELTEMKRPPGERIMAYMSTSHAARDLLRMVDKVEEHRNGTNPKPRLKYMGFSHGTVLGNYFASMFPGRVDKMVLDGVIDVYDYRAARGWWHSLKEFPYVKKTFWDDCYFLGHEVCDFAVKTERHLRDLNHRRKEWFQKLNKQPSMELARSGEMVTLTGEAARHGLTQAMYRPLHTFRRLATMYRDASAGNATQLVELVTSWYEPYFNGTYEEANPYVDFMDGMAAYICSDGESVAGQELTYWSEYCRATMMLLDFSSVPYWSEHKVSCASYPPKLRAQNTYTGPFGSPPAGLSLEGEPMEDRPSSPILFLRNKLDPLAKSGGVNRMSRRHKGSKVLKQDAIGHCALLSATSECMKDSVADYLDTGFLPEVSECKADCGPWDYDFACWTPEERRPLPDIPHKLFPFGVE